MAQTRRIDKPKFGRKKAVDQIFDRQPPVNLEAELAVLGSILLRPDACDDIVMILRPEDFYDSAHETLFHHIMAMHDAGKRIDVTLLVDELKRGGDFETIGGVPFLAKVGNAVATAAHAEHYAEIVRQDATRRSLINATTEILKDAYEKTDADAKLLVSQAEQSIFDISERGTGNTVSDIKEILHSAIDRMEARMSGQHIDGGCETGFTQLDELMGGLHNAELVILAARPSMGKTAFAMNIAEHVALKQTMPVLFVSLEMASIELADRMLCSIAEVNGSRLRNGTISRDDRKRLVEKAGDLSEAPLFIDDSPSRTVSEIAAAARRIKRKQGSIGLIVIDYLQLIEPDNADDPRQEQVAKMARRLKGVAREIDVPVLCLAQLNRQAEASKDNRPKLSHLRESGAIEQDADVVMFVHREEYYRAPDEREQFAGQADIIVAKQRNGPIGDVELVWRKEFTRFVNAAPAHYDEFEQFNTSEF